MKVRLPGTLASTALLIALGAVAGGIATRRTPLTSNGGDCDGAYAETLQALSPRSRSIEQSKRAQYTHLVRSTATYECPYFGPEGKLHRKRVEAMEHGTAFAYEVTNGETYLLTNEHLVAWPEVTAASDRVEGVQDGCKRVDEKVRIVQDEHDHYEAGHIPLVRVVADPLLDAAVLKATQALSSLPYAIGKSAGIRQGTAVQVRGFPLGLIHAVNTGKVVNPYDHDQEQGWDHVDFVVDALLSEGNSGSPVLALSCRTGDLQLVGMYHAGYKGHSALNVVIGIDQLRELMTKKKRIPRASLESKALLGVAGRKRLREALGSGALPLFEFGGLNVWIDTPGEALVYHVYGRDFPADDRRLAVLEDQPSPNGFGEVRRLWVRGDGPALRAWTIEALGAEERELVGRLLDALRAQTLRVLAYRQALAAPPSSEDDRRGRELLRTIDRQAVPAREMSGQILDLVERLGPARQGVAASLPDAGAAPPAPAPPAYHRPGGQPDPR